MDFTLKKYKELLEVLKEHFPRFYGFGELLSENPSEFIVLRHDVDRRPDFALAMARMESALGIKASYHFRISVLENRCNIISEISAIGHEVGYHYEDLSAVIKVHGSGLKQVSESVIPVAVRRFQANLGSFRKICHVNVISMHGSPLSAVDNRLLWKYFDYRQEGIICEPYFDIDASDLLYLTDTGRRWDGGGANIRDSGIYFARDEKNPYSEWVTRPLRGSLMYMVSQEDTGRAGINIRSTADIISSASLNKLPQKIIINTHPQRWTDKALPWMSELVLQNLKNQIKKVIRTNKML